MKINLIGIDFSLNSTSLCIKENDKYSFHNFINTNSFIGKKGQVLAAWKIHNEITSFINFVFVKRAKLPNNYTATQLQKLLDYEILTNEIINKIPPNSIIGIEGFSYASKGRSEVDLIMAQSLLRYKLYVLKGYDLIIIPPSNIKKDFTTKGNANKVKMLESFKIIKHPIIDHPLYNYVLNTNLIKKESTVLKPIDDLIDSFAIVNFLEKN